MRISGRSKRGIAAVLAVSAADVGFWAEFAPRSFYDSFPLAGHPWVSVPHFIYHMVHLGVFGTADSIGNIVTLGGTVILAALLLLPTAGPGSGVGDGRQSPGVLRAAGRAIREAG